MRNDFTLVIALGHTDCRLDQIEDKHEESDYEPEIMVVIGQLRVDTADKTRVISRITQR